MADDDAENVSPIIKLATLLLNEASRLNAQAVSLSLDGQGETARIAMKYRIEGHWTRQESPPMFLWNNLRNLYMLWAGVEYWRQAAASGTIRRDGLAQAWSLKIPEAHDRIDLELVP